MDTKPNTRRPDPWVAFTNDLTRRAEAAEQALAAITAERDGLADSIRKLTAERDAYKASLANVKPEIAKDPAVFPDAANLQKMVPPNSFSNEARQSLSQVFTLFKKGT